MLKGSWYCAKDQREALGWTLRFEESSRSWEEAGSCQGQTDKHGMGAGVAAVP